MAYIELETSGDSHRAVINTGQIAYLSEGIYGTSIHFTSGEYLVCVGDLDDVMQQQFSGQAHDSYVIASPVAATFCTMSRASSRVFVMGLSHMTSNPRSRAAMAYR